MKDRIKKYIESKGVTAGELAAILDVQRSNISHILNGRNMPGAAFLEKLLIKFPDLDARWLLTGNGDMIISNESKAEVMQHEDISAKKIEIESINKSPNIENIEEMNDSGRKARHLKRIVFFYSDGSFEDFKKQMMIDDL